MLGPRHSHHRREPRRSVVADLRECGRLVVLTGPPGVGKTRLALGVAAAVTDGFRDGVAWVDLTPVRDPAVVVDEIVHAAGLAHAAALHDRDLLVVLDNCEHLLAAAPAVATLVAAHPGLVVLATSRSGCASRPSTTTRCSPCRSPLRSP